MFKTVILLLISFSGLSQENIKNLGTYKYAPLQDNKVYDVEIIVFAYNNALPNYLTFKNKTIFDESNALELQLKPENLLYIKKTKNTEVDEKTNRDRSSEFTVSLEDDTNQQEALVWFNHNPEFYKLTKIWDKLLTKQNTTPLLHKAWRQTETEFNNPIYVRVSNMDNDDTQDNISSPLNQLSSTSIDGLSISTTQKFIYPDYSLTGMVALSKGRYMHFGHSLNLFRTYRNESDETKNMVFSLKERRQLKTDQLNYFDSPWIGSIVKITEYTGELKNEKNDD